MRVYLRQARAHRRGIHHVVDSLSCQWLAAFTDKQPRQLAIAGLKVALDGSELIAGYRLFDGQTVLKTSHPQARSFRIDVFDLDRYRLANTQTVAKHHQHNEVIADAMTTFLIGLGCIYPLS